MSDENDIMNQLQQMLGGGAGGGAGFDMGSLMQQAQAMQAQVVEAQERANSREVSGEAGGGLVKVTANGKLEITKLEIDKSVVDPEDIEMLQDLVAAAVNVALRNAREVMGEELGPLKGMLDMGGMNL